MVVLLTIVDLETTFFFLVRDAHATMPSDATLKRSEIYLSLSFEVAKKDRPRGYIVRRPSRSSGA